MELARLSISVEMRSMSIRRDEKYEYYVLETKTGE